jgi:hypothetical protein
LNPFRGLGDKVLDTYQSCLSGIGSNVPKKESPTGRLFFLYLSVRRNKDGSVQYRFTFVDTDGKRRRLPQHEIPNIKDEA